MNRLDETNNGGRIRLRPRLLVVLGLAALCLWAASWPAAAQGQPDDVAVNRDLTIQKDEVVQGDVGVTNGNLALLGEVRGDVAVVNGNAQIDGKVGGDVAVLANGRIKLGKGSEIGGNVIANGGEIELEAGSLVRGNVTSLGGKVYRHPQARIEGEVSAPVLSLGGIGNEVVGGQPPPSEAQPEVQATEHGLTFFDRILAFISQGVIGIVVIVAGALMVAFIPKRVSLASATLEAEPVGSIIVGLIAAFLLVPLVGIAAAILGISIIGIPFIPVLALGVLLLWLFGLVTVSAWIGRGVYETARHGQAGQTSHLMVEVLLGLAIVLGATLVPSSLVPGFVTFVMGGLVYLAACIGLGAVVLSRYGTLAPPGRFSGHSRWSNIAPPRQEQPGLPERARRS